MSKSLWRLTLLNVCCLFVSPPDAFAACSVWAMDGVIEIRQSNNIVVTMTVKTDKGGGVKEIATTGSNSGQVNGLIMNDGFRSTGLYMNIQWQNVVKNADFPHTGVTTVQSKGVYRANITEDGRLVDGTTFDADHRESRATFSLDENLICRAAASPPPPSPPPAASPFCQRYATAAVVAAMENMQLRCGNGGPRWSTATAGHLDWCMTLNGNQGPPNTETAARASALQTCRADVRAREEAVQKPGIPIGDIVKPVDPMDRLGVLKKPNEGLGQVLKPNNP